MATCALQVHFQLSVTASLVNLLMPLARRSKQKNAKQLAWQNRLVFFSFHDFITTCCLFSFGYFIFLTIVTTSLYMHFSLYMFFFEPVVYFKTISIPSHGRISYAYILPSLDPTCETILGLFLFLYFSFSQSYHDERANCVYYLYKAKMADGTSETLPLSMKSNNVIL